jgi:hypothetical protein
MSNETTTRPTKTGDLYRDIQNGYYSESHLKTPWMNYKEALENPIANANRAEEMRTLGRELSADFGEEFGINPHSDLYGLVWEMAWERGHSAGLTEVYIYFGEILDFANRVIATVTPVK